MLRSRRDLAARARVIYCARAFHGAAPVLGMAVLDAAPVHSTYARYVSVCPATHYILLVYYIPWWSTISYSMRNLCFIPLMPQSV
ncbi:hypothetical protein C8F04DRAFT_1102319 [Mycena alexandri]|uniref:Uncharacterized protein n=1 Tax=Mycena alexandri TaxID=1745969 RepID=A0AAD6X6W2_9AGAR|nr:hypothetical protein C8F04DRAFT_1102319 [Mycena alexandri]